MLFTSGSTGTPKGVPGTESGILVRLRHWWSAYPFGADETIHALEGELVIDLVETGETVVLKPGDVASFTKGTKSTWTVTSPFKKLFVISG